MPPGTPSTSPLQVAIFTYWNRFILYILNNTPPNIWIQILHEIFYLVKNSKNKQNKLQFIDILISKYKVSGIIQFSHTRQHKCYISRIDCYSYIKYFSPWDIILLCVYNFSFEGNILFIWINMYLFIYSIFSKKYVFFFLSSLHINLRAWEIKSCLKIKWGIISCCMHCYAVLKPIWQNNKWY